MPAAKSKGKKRALSAALGTGEASSSKRIKSDSPDSRKSVSAGCTWPCGGLTHSAACSEPGLRILMQDKFCLATAYKDAKLSKCTSCSRRNGKDTCRFRDIRYIKRDAAGAFRGIGFKTKPAQTLGRVRFPDSWNERPRKEHINIIKVGAMLSCTLHSIVDLTVKRVVAAGLLPVLQREIKHLEHQDTISRPREIDVRATCGKESHCLTWHASDCVLQTPA